MERVHILVAVPFMEEEHMAGIAAIDPSLEVTNVRQAIEVELQLPSAMVPPGDRHAGMKLTREEASRILERELPQADIFFGWRLPRNLPARAPRLKWVQGIAAGLDQLVGDSGIIDSDIVITNAHENSTAVAEYALYLTLMLAKKAPVLFHNKEARQWQRYAPSELKGGTMGVVGLGAIGSKVAGYARAFGMRVLATRRSALSREKDAGGVDEVFPPGELRQMLPECDFVVIAVPLLPDTRGMIGEAELRAMKPTSYIVNVARGPIVRQDVLVRALREEWIAGAGLDVFETEPLPPDNELWEMPNVILSPHVAWISAGEVAAVVELFYRNLRRFLNGEELINLVDKARGY